MKRFRLRRAVNIKEPLYVVPPSSGALLSSELSVDLDRHSQLLGGIFNMDMSIRDMLWKRRTGGSELEIGEHGPGSSGLL